MTTRQLNFVPTDFSGCVLWLRADQGITRDLSGNVSQWDDQSGLGNHVSQATANLRPLIVNSDVNFAQRSTIRSTGTQFIRRSATNLFAAGAYTIFTAHLLFSTSGDPVIVASGRAAGGVSFHTNGNNRSVIHNSVANHDDGAPSVILPEIWSSTYNAITAPTLRVNSVNQTLSNTGSTTLTDPGGTSLLEIFNLATGNIMTGKIAEVVMFNRALAPAETAILELYLSSRYQISLS